MQQNQVADPVHNSDQAGDSEHAINATQASLDRVRDILFGAQIREQDHRRQEFEGELEKQLSAFGEESRKRLDALEGFVKRQIASVLEILKTESQQRAEALQSIAGQLKQTATGIERRIAAVDEQHSDAERKLHTELLDQSNSLRDEVSGLGQSLTSLLEKTRTDLQHAKADRVALASIYVEMAQRLSE
jgi:hypothetical protein